MANCDTRWDVEQQLMQIWREALDVSTVQREDDFFSLGGDSVAATKVMTAIEERLSQNLPMSALVDNPTIALLAARIESAAVDLQDDGALLVTIRESGTRPPLFLVHGLMGHIVFAHVLGRFLGEDQPLYALRARGFNGEAPHQTVNEMAASYLEQIRRVHPNVPLFLGGYCSGSLIALEMAQQLREAGVPPALLLAIDPLEAGRSFARSRLKLATDASSEEVSSAVRANLRQRLECDVYGHGGIAQQRMEWAINVAASLDAAFAAYQPKSYPAPIQVLASIERYKDLRRADKSWNQIGGKHLRVRVLTERHLQMFMQNGKDVADAIRELMNRASSL